MTRFLDWLARAAFVVLVVASLWITFALLTYERPEQSTNRLDTTPPLWRYD